MAAMRSDDQLGLDEELVENPDVEAALVERQARKDALKAVRKDFNKAHEKAVAALASIELPEDGAVRVGRFRITKRQVEGGHREFDTQDREQLSISFLGDETPRTKRRTAGDDADLRPTGEVNPAALRGEAERSSAPTPIRRGRNGGSQPPAVH